MSQQYPDSPDAASVVAPPAAPAGRASVAELDSKHAYWNTYHDHWDALDLLFRSGHAIQQEAARFLRRRPKELSEVFASRLAAFDHQPIMGTVLGWYQSKLFSKDPSIDIRLRGNSDPTALSDDRKKPYTDFLMNCDRSGTTYVDLWRQVFQNLLVFRGCYVCVDLPRLEAKPSNKAEQRAAGGLDPYLAVWDPRSVTNWDVDEFGNLAWIVIKVQSYKKSFLGDGLVVDRWYYYDRSDYRIYERTKVISKDNGGVELYGANGQLMASTDQTADLIDSGPHSMSGSNRVPVRYITIPEGLWLANRAFLPSMAHLNLENSYQWALTMANLPVAVVKGDSEFNQTISETAFIQLDQDASFEWTEPAGTSFQHSAEHLSAKREEIFRSVFLSSQGRDSSASASSSSGYSKEMDLLPAKDVLAAFGDIIRASGQNLLQDVALVRGDEDIEFDVRGFNFEINPALQEAETAELIISLDIPSDTLLKQIQKRVAQSYLSDANRAIIETVNDEIDDAPTRDELAAQQAGVAKLAMDRALNRSVSSVAGTAESAAP